MIFTEYQVIANHTTPAFALIFLPTFNNSVVWRGVSILSLTSKSSHCFENPFFMIYFFRLPIIITSLPLLACLAITGGSYSLHVERKDREKGKGGRRVRRLECMRQIGSVIILLIYLFIYVSFDLNIHLGASDFYLRVTSKGLG